MYSAVLIRYNCRERKAHFRASDEIISRPRVLVSFLCYFKQSRKSPEREGYQAVLPAEDLIIDCSGRGGGGGGGGSGYLYVHSPPRRLRAARVIELKLLSSCVRTRARKGTSEKAHGARFIEDEWLFVGDDVK